MVEGGGSVIAAFFLAHNYVSEQFGNYVEYGSGVSDFLGLKSYEGVTVNVISIIWGGGHEIGPIP